MILHLYFEITLIFWISLTVLDLLYIGDILKGKSSYGFWMSCGPFKKVIICIIVALFQSIVPIMRVLVFVGTLITAFEKK